ncbi:HupE/UreJ family protein [Deinococcus misasensis]|uniref:HupE/UreJ family protein n=1 Tax=Deinococcus misasensis TaxID=392413 RepID=UPI00068C68B4|nr:HupE/UreJ family protein [Deinococcus misasensis]
MTSLYFSANPEDSQKSSGVLLLDRQAFVSLFHALKRLLSLWMLVFLFTGAAFAHQITFSHVDLKLTSSGTTLQVKLPALALLHETGLLPAGTTSSTLQHTPLDAKVQKILSELVQSRLQVNASGQKVPLTVTEILPAGEDVQVTLSAPTLQGKLEVKADLFPEDTLHKVFMTVYKNEALLGQYALDHQNASVGFDAPEPLWQVIVTFIREGIHHIFIGVDHIVFVVALLLLGGSLRAQVKIITAFTVSHSITLVLAALNILQPSGTLVESLIALSIVVVGVHDLLHLRKPESRGKRDLRVFFAFGFGLIHGFGFASVLGALNLPEDQMAWSLGAFNVGVELGQVMVLLLLMPVLGVLHRKLTAVVYRNALLGVATLVVVTGGVWFVQRAFMAG